ncbi:hypothetical protein BpHYR1_034866 [Brachionus plicatilis]|uniref:Uncharacterized protein n=1 Tax=Brachionus plicatilis TaxID=10195 RepID=A0A3M7SH61_BRAPC|nr:hypothetical protein BpHYR1_034866 [Brachionus plicatilis]
MRKKYLSFFYFNLINPTLIKKRENVHKEINNQYHQEKTTSSACTINTGKIFAKKFGIFNLNDILKKYKINITTIFDDILKAWKTCSDYFNCFTKKKLLFIKIEEFRKKKNY